jgi:stearoyl-CoA desaturase (delta-9 desaturase)
VNSAATRASPWTALRRWFDGRAAAEATTDPVDRVDWVRIAPFLALHVACFAAFWTGTSVAALTTAVVLFYVRLFAITGFYHRYFSHRSYRTNRFWQFVFAVVGNAAAQRGPLWWAAHHRFHHRHADGPEDRHSPRRRGFWWSHVGWFTSPANFRTEVDLVRDLARFPELVFLDRFSGLVPALLFAALYGFGALAATYRPEWATDGPQMLVWGVISTVALYHATYTINSLAHVFGTRRFATADDSKNNWLLALLTLGEGWHNNHHRYQSSARNGFYPHEVDITWYVLRLFAALGIVSDLKPVPASVLAEGLSGDGRSASRSSNDAPSAPSSRA